jgi:hypothetical protein
MDLPDAPARWGDMRQHMFYGALYHWFVLTGFWDYRGFRPHRSLTVGQEFLLYCKRLHFCRCISLNASWRPSASGHGGFPYHLVLMQLEHDSSFQMHSPFSTMTEFLSLVIEGFARGAPPHHHLVFKAHPLEDGRVPVAREIRRLARAHGVASVSISCAAASLAALLNHARSPPSPSIRPPGSRCFGAACRSRPSARPSMPSPSSSRPNRWPISSPRPCPPRQPRLPRLSPLPAGNQPGSGRLLLGPRPPRAAAAGCRHDAVPRRSL